MMKTPIALVLGLFLALAPAAASAQSDPSPAPAVVDMELVERLCAATSADLSEQEACIEAVEAALAQMRPEDGQPAEEPSLLDRAEDILDDTQALIDEALEQVREVDLQQAIDEVVEDAREFQLDVSVDLQQAIDEAVAAIEALELPDGSEVQQALEEAVRESLSAAEEIDLQAALDEALADAQGAIEDANVQGVLDETVLALEETVAEARAVVAEAEQWARENTDAVCRGGSVSLGTTVGVAVFALTGVEWLGLQAFWATERFTNGVCGDITR